MNSLQVRRRPLGKTYFIPSQMQGIGIDYTDWIPSWITEPVSSAYEYVSGGVSGTWEKFKNYYDAIKNRWGEFISIRPKLDALVVRLSVARMKADQRKDAKAVDDIDDLRIKVAALTNLWISVKEKYDSWIGKWIQAEKEQEGLSGLGIAPIVLAVVGVASIAAAAYIAKHMIDIFADYSKLSDLTDKVEKGLITPEQATKIYKETRSTSPSMTEMISEKIGIGIGGGIGTGLMIVAGGIGIAGLIWYMRRK